MNRFVFLVIAIASVFLSACTPRGNADSPISRDGFYFDTVISLYIYDTDESAAKAALDECFEQAEYYDGLFSNTDPQSDVSRINAGAGSFVEVDPETIDLIKTGIRYGEISGGLLDITMGKVSNLWDFSGNAHIPDESELIKALEDVDYRKISFEEDVKVQLENPGAKLDLGAVAKGYIADRMKETLVSHGIESAIISLGGNINLVGGKPDGSDFRVGIQDPGEEDGTAIYSVEAKDTSVVTSGNYQRYFEQDGKRYHHILEPESGYPCNNGVASVSIITASSTDADALSTTCFLLGTQKGLLLIESLEDTEAIFVTDEGELILSSGLN